MADFAVLEMEGNTNTNAAPNWVDIDHEVRWSDLATQHDIASAVWPAMIRPAATAAVAYTYAYTADAVGNGFISTNGGVNTPAFDVANYLWARWDWDVVGTFASAPIFTAYPTVAHGAPVADDGTLLGGKIADTGGAGYSYLKGNAFGRVVSAGAPAAAPAAAPAVGDGAAGSVSPVAGANWIATFQSLQGDISYITAPFTPAATTADQWNVMFALFTGPNMVPALYQVVMSLRYTWT